jgi:multimeric flavodoxin WrbA
LTFISQRRFYKEKDALTKRKAEKQTAGESQGGITVHVLAINGSPRRKGNTSTIVDAILTGAKEAGADTQHVRLDEIDLKGCMGCLSCREEPGFCERDDGLSPVLEVMKTTDAVVAGCPIYMYHISGQMKLFIDRIYSFYVDREDGGYASALPTGKRFAFVTSQGHPDPERFSRTIRWLEGMIGGLGMESAGKIIHANSHVNPAKDAPDLLERAKQIGRALAG